MRILEVKTHPQAPSDANQYAPKVMKASEFKAKCLQLMDEVATYNGEIVITKNNKPVARLLPYGNRKETLLGSQRGRIQILGEIINVADIWDEWEAETDPDRVLNP